MRIGTRFYRLFTTLCISITFSLAASYAAASAESELIEALQAQINTLTSRLDALENAQPAGPTSAGTLSPGPARPQTKPAPSWADTITLKGDFRYRHEAFDIEDTTDRHRQRLRARTELSAQINDTTRVGFGLASGNSDPISTNQTIGNAASSKGVVLDLAYVDWATPVDGMSVLAGKFKNPLHRAGGNGLIWDSDLRPEGVALRYRNGHIFANAMGLYIDEDSSGEDALMLGGQFGINTNLGAGKLRAGAGYYHFTDAKDREVFFVGIPLGNRVNPDGTYVSDFEIVEGFAEYSFGLNQGTMTLFADYANNLGADDFETGYAFGVRLEQEKWNFSWAYQDLEADAVLGLFTDSDFIGGGTDGKGHILQTGYALTKRVGLRGTLFLNDRNIAFGPEEEFKRLMLDISFKY